MTDELFMQRCLDLAQLGAGRVSPNPMVGAVLVSRGRVIGEGWHERWGDAHAEVRCLESVRPAHQSLISHATLYCNLEPCAHYGKTPPCADLIVRHDIKRVVTANADPNPLVAGRGFEKLRSAGIEVIEGVLREKGAWLNRTFFTWITQKRPYVVLKWAQSSDGFLGKKGERTAISGPLAARWVHRLRAESDAIMIGANTAQVDDPQLDTRYYFGKNPLRVVLDTRQKLPASHHLLDDRIETLVIGPPAAKKMVNTRFTGHTGYVSLNDILQILYEEHRAILLVEGGSDLLHQFIKLGLWDEIHRLEHPMQLHSGVAAPVLPANAKLLDEFQIAQDRVCTFARDF